jgi:hypothetical protein
MGGSQNSSINSLQLSYLEYSERGTGDGVYNDEDTRARREVLLDVFVE